MRYLISFFALLALLSSCEPKNELIVAQMKLRRMQSRTYVGHNSHSVSKEMIQILQDEGYMVKNVSTDIGLITAELDTDIETFRSKFWAYLFSGKRACWKKHSVIEITANITERENQTKIRINYVVRVFDNLGRIVDVHQVLEDNIYATFFNKIQQGLLKKELHYENTPDRPELNHDNRPLCSRGRRSKQTCPN